MSRQANHFSKVSKFISLPLFKQLLDSSLYYIPVGLTELAEYAVVYQEEQLGKDYQSSISSIYNIAI